VKALDHGDALAHPARVYDLLDAIGDLEQLRAVAGADLDALHGTGWVVRWMADPVEGWHVACPGEAGRAGAGIPPPPGSRGSGRDRWSRTDPGDEPAQQKPVDLREESDPGAGRANEADRGKL
jgi:hypothetical protein